MISRVSCHDVSERTEGKCSGIVRPYRRCPGWAFLLLVTAAWYCAFAENIVFPAKAGLKNAVTDFGAKGDGKTDDTQALTNAFGVGNSYAVYIPNGTYRVTAPILARTVSRGPWVYGQSRNGVVIKLDDNASGFGNASSPQPVLAAHAIPPGGAISADLFFRQWHNFTVDAGNNAGAIGIRYYANNSGILDNVLVKGNGVYGIDMGWTNMNGPCLIRDVVVEGFGTGVYTNNGINSQTMTGITIRNSRIAGISASGQNLSIEDLVIENVPTAVEANGMICIVNGTFKGTDPAKPAIRNRANLYCRNVATQGFSRAIESSNGGVSGATVTEFTSENIAAAFTDYRRGSLNLPIKKTPSFQWEEDTSKWVNVQDFGALPSDRFEDSKGFQDAIDSAAARGKTTVYVPSGAYTLVTDVFVHGSVRHILGIGDAEAVLTFSSTTDKGFVLRDNAAPVVRIADFIRCAGLTITSNNTSALIIENCVDFRVAAAGRGEVYINNCVGNIVVSNPGARVWARQWNTEGGGIDSDNQGGLLWILGLKTEKRSTKIRTTRGGMSELLGAHIYNNNCSGPTRLFEITDAFASFASTRETSFCGGPYQEHVGETRSGVTKTWLGNPKAWALYSGAPASFAPPSPTGVRQPPARPGIGSSQRQRVVDGRWRSSHVWQSDEIVFDCRGARAMSVRTAQRSRRGTVGVYVVETPGGVRRVLAGGR